MVRYGFAASLLALLAPATQARLPLPISKLREYVGQNFLISNFVVRPRRANNCPWEQRGAGQRGKCQSYKLTCTRHKLRMTSLLKQ